jgi:hypothetical protein
VALDFIDPWSKGKSCIQVIKKINRSDLDAANLELALIFDRKFDQTQDTIEKLQN